MNCLDNVKSAQRTLMRKELSGDNSFLLVLLLCMLLILLMVVAE